jgi:hypothetical protein
VGHAALIWETNTYRILVEGLVGRYHERELGISADIIKIDLIEVDELI